MTPRARFERESLWAKEAGDELLFPVQTVAASDTDAQCRREQHDRRDGECGGAHQATSPQPGAGRAVDGSAPSAEHGSDDEARAAAERHYPDGPDRKRLPARPDRRRERHHEMSGHVAVPGHVTDDVERI